MNRAPAPQPRRPLTPAQLALAKALARLMVAEEDRGRLALRPEPRR